MRAVRSLTSTAVTLLVLAAVAVVLLAFALPRVQVPGLDTTGVEQRAQGLVQTVASAGGAVLGEGVAVVTGAVRGAVDGATSAAR